MAPATALAPLTPTTVLTPFMPVFYVSFLVTLILTPLMRALAHRNGIVDVPDGRRKVHTQPIAYLGGVATFFGWLAGITISAFIPVPHEGRHLALLVPPGVLMGALTVMLFGLMDDVYGLPPRIKLFGQFLAGVFLFLFSIDPQGFIGIRLDMANMLIMPLERYGVISPFQVASPHLYAIIATALSAALVIFIIVSCCNATNLLDGLDGLCSGVTGIMAVGYLVLAVHLAITNIPSPGVMSVDPTRLTLALALLGAVLGFLPFNFNPASIFMGDTGSMFLGFICGTMIVMFGADGIARWFLGAVVVFGLPMLDTLLAIVRRKLNGRPIFSADSSHFHHFLIRRGMSVRKAVLISYGVAALFVSFALVVVVIPTRLALGVYMVLFGWLVVSAFKLGMVFQQKSVSPVNRTIISLESPHQEAINENQVAAKLAS